MNTAETFKFCPKCKSDLSYPRDNVIHCEKCSFHYYVNSSPCLSIFTRNEEGKILFIRRKLDPHKGMIGLPGGFVEAGETFEECLIRETREELDTGVTNIKYLSSIHDDYHYKGVDYKTIGNIFSVDLESYDLEPHDDVAEIMFYNYSEIPFDKMAFQGQVRFLKEQRADFE